MMNATKAADLSFNTQIKNVEFFFLVLIWNMIAMHPSLYINSKRKLPMISIPVSIQLCLKKDHLQELLFSTLHQTTKKKTSFVWVYPFFNCIEKYMIIAQRRSGDSQHPRFNENIALQNLKKE